MINDKNQRYRKQDNSIKTKLQKTKPKSKTPIVALTFSLEFVKLFRQ